MKREPIAIVLKRLDKTRIERDALRSAAKDLLEDPQMTELLKRGMIYPDKINKLKDLLVNLDSKYNRKYSSLNKLI